jgi:hypothetical protein
MCPSTSFCVAAAAAGLRPQSIEVNVAIVYSLSKIWLFTLSYTYGVS